MVFKFPANIQSLIISKNAKSMITNFDIKILKIHNLLAEGKKCSSGLHENLLANASPGMVIR